MPWIQVLREKLEAVNKDVKSIKKLAFDIPQGLNRNLVFFWVANVLSVLGRFIMFNVVELKEEFSVPDAKNILMVFLGEELMTQEFEVVKERIAKDSFMIEQFETLMQEVMSHTSLTEQLRCKHRSSSLSSNCFNLPKINAKLG